MTEIPDSKRSTRWWLREDSSSVEIAASSAVLYDMVADLPRMGEWSPECQRVDWLEPATGPVEGARFIGHNRGAPAGLLRWSRRGRVLIANPGREFAFATEEGGKEGVVWRYRFEPVEGGTKVTETYQVSSIPAWARIVDVPTNRVRQLREGMQHTLEQLKQSAEASTPAS